MRTKTIITTSKSDEDVKNILGSILISHKYIFTQYKKQNVWKKGSGWLTAPQIFTVNKSADKVIIESWLPSALLPGVYFGESGLDSSYGFAVKASMRKILIEMINAVKIQDSVIEGYSPKI